MHVHRPAVAIKYRVRPVVIHVIEVGRFVEVVTFNEGIELEVLQALYEPGQPQQSAGHQQELAGALGWPSTN